jgi:hypothetical protein
MHKKERGSVSGSKGEKVKTCYSCTGAPTPRSSPGASHPDKIVQVADEPEKKSKRAGALPLASLTGGITIRRRGRAILYG